MTVAKHTSPPFIYSGLSSDTKPDATPLSIFYETDTGDEFLMLSSWTQCKDALSQYTTLTTLLAGENGASYSGGYIQVSGGGPEYKEYDMSGGTNQTTWATEKKLILGIRYYGDTGGIIGFVDYGDNETYITVRDATQYGIQEIGIQAKVIYGQGNGTFPTTACGDANDILGIFKTKVMTS